MEKNLDIILQSMIALLLFLVGLAALIGGLKRKPNPFFWLKNYNSIFLKTPTHYVIAGLTCIVGSLIFLFRLLALWHIS